MMIKHPFHWIDLIIRNVPPLPSIHTQAAFLYQAERDTHNSLRVADCALRFAFAFESKKTIHVFWFGYFFIIDQLEFLTTCIDKPITRALPLTIMISTMPYLRWFIGYCILSRCWFGLTSISFLACPDVLSQCWDEYRDSRQSPLWSEQFFRCDRLTQFYECSELKQGACIRQNSRFSDLSYQVYRMVQDICNGIVSTRAAVKCKQWQGIFIRWLCDTN